MAETLKSGNVPILITNIEVLQMLEDKLSKRRVEESDHEKPATGTKVAAAALHHRDWIEEKVCEYVKSSPCGNAIMKRMPQFVSILKRPKKSVKNKEEGGGGNERQGFGLTDGETLQILNSMPSVLAELYLIIEDLDSRLTEEDQTELLELIEAYRQ
jgi:hypothetical protein